MKRMLLLSAVALSLMVMSGCRNSWNRTFFRGSPCGNPTAPGCGCGTGHAGMAIPGSTVIDGGAVSGEAIVSPEQALTLPSPGVGAAGSSAPIVTP